MVKVTKNSELYKNMVETEKEALVSRDDLLNNLKNWLSSKIEDDVADTAKIILAAGGYIQIRMVKPFEEDVLQAFLSEFNFSKTWFKKERMTDYRNVEEVSVTVYEYGFIPSDITKILSDNQVDLVGEDEHDD